MGLYWNSVLLYTVLIMFLSSLPTCRSHANQTHLARRFDIFELVNSTLHCEQQILTARYYDVLPNGSLFLPHKRRMYDEERFYIDNDVAFICDTDHESDDEYLYSYLSEEFRNCLHVPIENDEFKFLDNGTVFVENYNKLYSYTDYLLHENGIYVCSHSVPNHTDTYNSSHPQSHKFSPAFSYVTYVGISISVVSLVLHLIVFCCIPKVRNLPGFCLASLSMSLLLAYIFFMSKAVAGGQHCTNIGICQYYFFLSSFFWMNSIAFDVWRSFRAVIRELRITSHKVPWKRFLAYSIYSWGIPAALAVLALFADKTDFFPLEYRPSFDLGMCWFGKRKSLTVFFVTPLCVVLGLNAIFFLDSSYIINVATMKTSQANETQMKKRFFMFMRLAALMGLTWIVGIIAGYVDREFLWYVFVILNTLQGLFIFIVFSCSSKVRVFLFRKLHRSGNDRQCQASVKTVSTVSAAL